MTKHAILLAGGKGTRLRPYTVVLPKPLMPIGEYPILEVVVRQLAWYGFKRITMAVNHQAELVKAFFNDGKKWDVSIDYTIEDTPLGTMGPLRLSDDLPEHFLVMNGDVLTDLDFAKFYDEHVTGNHIFTISSYCRQHVIDYGVLETDPSGQLVGFREKPDTEFEVSMGIYMASRDVLDFIPESRLYGFDDLMYDLIRAKKNVRVKNFKGFWLDIGRPDDYIQAIEQFENMKGNFIHG